MIDVFVLGPLNVKLIFAIVTAPLGAVRRLNSLFLFSDQDIVLGYVFMDA